MGCFRDEAGAVPAQPTHIFNADFNADLDGRSRRRRRARRMIDLAWYSPRECSRSKTSEYLGCRCLSCLPNINVFFPF